MNRSRPIVLLTLIAAILLGLAYVLSKGSADAERQLPPASAHKPPRVAPVYPRDAQRIPPAAPAPAPLPTPGPLVRDPERPPPKPSTIGAMERAVLRPDGRGAVFVEVNALRHTPLAEKILRCTGAQTLDGIKTMEDELGINPMEDLDRVGTDGDVVVASGFFERLRVPEELGEGTPYGERGRIWQEGPEGVWFGKVGDELVMTGDEEAEVKAAMDRAEGKSPAGAPLREELSHSEMYGSFTKEMIGQLFSDSAMQQIGSMIEGSDMRMNVDDNVALSLDMRAKDPETAENLQKALRGAFSLMRVEASKNGEQELEWLLGQARITPQGEGKLGLDFAVPGTFLLRQMGCTPEGDSIPQ